QKRERRGTAARDGREPAFHFLEREDSSLVRRRLEENIGHLAEFEADELFPAFHERRLRRLARHSLVKTADGGFGITGTGKKRFIRDSIALIEDDMMQLAAITRHELDAPAPVVDNGVVIFSHGADEVRELGLTLLGRDFHRNA